MPTSGKERTLTAKQAILLTLGIITTALTLTLSVMVVLIAHSESSNLNSPQVVHVLRCTGTCMVMV